MGSRLWRLVVNVRGASAFVKPGAAADFLTPKGPHAIIPVRFGHLTNYLKGGLRRGVMSELV